MDSTNYLNDNSDKVTVDGSQSNVNANSNDISKLNGIKPNTYIDRSKFNDGKVEQDYEPHAEDALDESEAIDENILEESESEFDYFAVLMEVDSEKVRPTMKIMKDDFPNNLHAYTFLDTLLNWKREDANIAIHILSPNGDPNLGIVFYIVYGKVFAGSVYAANEEAVLKLEEALVARRRSHYFQMDCSIFTCLNDFAYESLKNISTCLEWQERKQEVLWLPWYVAREINVAIPMGLEVRPLQKEHAKQIDYYWSERHPGSEELIAVMIEHNLGFGVFKRNSLISWALVWYYGGIGCLQTVDREKMKGYSQIAIAALTKRMGELQTDVHISVLERNKKHLHFFKALGFRYAFTSMWIIKNCEKLNWDYY